MRKYILPLVVLFLTTSLYAQKVKKVDGSDYGAGITADSYINFQHMLKDLGASAGDTVNVTVRATVNEVCQAKGCWMTLQDDNPDMQDVMVKFKDYGFFVPKDIGGKEVLIEGKAYTTVVPVDELRHYAEDAGKSAEEIAQITEPQRKYAFLASGVRVVE